jgi:hypothetical protein
MADNKIQPDEQLIQRKAYELWQLRGCPAGNPEHDWFEAVQQLRTAAHKPEQDVASVRADARALATQVQQAARSSAEPPAAAQPAATTKRPSAPAGPREKLQNGFKTLAKENRAGNSRKAGKG